MNVYYTSRNNPCYNEGNDCPDRTLGCHSTCPKHLEWLEEIKKLHDKRQQESTRQADAKAYSIGIHQKLAKIRNQAKSKKGWIK